GLPEVSLGILPGAGGTQRLPRLIGAGPALGLMLSGLPVGAKRAAELGLVDIVTEGAAGPAAETLARSMAAGEVGLAETVQRQDHRGEATLWLRAIAAAREGLGRGRLPAPARIIDCVEAALLLPEEEGLGFERAAFEDLVTTPEAAALRHAFLSERRAARQPDLAGAGPREVNGIGIIGGGLMGSGIATALLAAGYRVTLVERDRTALSVGLARIATNQERAVAKGRMNDAAREEAWSRIAGVTDMASLSEMDMVIEAVPEDEELKAGIFAELGKVTRSGAVLATNTSYLDVNRFAEASGRPEDVIGLHFFSPAQVMKLLEVVVADQTAPDVTATAFALAKRMGKVAVRAGVCDGFIGNRILTAYRTATDFLLEDGASPYDIDRAMVAWGFPKGPYEVLDMAGLDISWARRRRLAATRDPEQRYVAIGDRLCEAGRLGQKAGKGYYLYEGDSRQGQEDPEVLGLIVAERQARGIVPRQVTEAEIQTRALAAMANEGARILAEGIAARPSDIDVVMMLGYGFPRWRGGPMQAADRAGLLALRNDLRNYAREEESFWAPVPLWDQLIKNGRKFKDMNGE
ncbi:MAG: 3-hydroxyacyl-CoA dehydrogenase NAD-binding domain-containing protein, partial [Albidovulum sp.]|uniref:3-hydroxyacyl-CoA dehydrogenase NAD-binding domain-containing protein n=1 Tax=Albidovulum sp. TaxID=1872424 RepID=UPI003C9AD94D